MNGPSLMLLMALLVPVQDRPAAARGTLADLGWLAGNWSGTQGRATIEERWTPAAGGAMLAVSRTVKDDKLAAFECASWNATAGWSTSPSRTAGRRPSSC